MTLENTISKMYALRGDDDPEYVTAEAAILLSHTLERLVTNDYITGPIRSEVLELLEAFDEVTEEII